MELIHFMLNLKKMYSGIIIDQIKLSEFGIVQIELTSFWLKVIRSSKEVNKCMEVPFKIVHLFVCMI